MTFLGLISLLRPTRSRAGKDGVHKEKNVEEAKVCGQSLFGLVTLDHYFDGLNSNVNRESRGLQNKKKTWSGISWSP